MKVRKYFVQVTKKKRLSIEQYIALNNDHIEEFSIFLYSFE